ncbi:Cytochrome c oxidase, cbb3-type, subunit II [Sulfurovum sp. enrichment culture clone C5]|uniref:Cytochrome c oxidase, cbb3-type, subunit II n=1 Tax=Sulfurovum sp. enrichment culture clone C5 TaxID=497650 RepID=A0A0S4XL72_9BACT|nr:Cytochrome c oxidase, cbb3-type, subunit II [Sulfurovum sp. enrichment culture clone C5]
MFHWLEKNPFFFAVGVFVVIAFAGLIEILPNFAEASRPVVNLKPYTVLEMAGKNIYKNENCITCHSQLIRPFKSETDRYGQVSLSGEYVYDRPFLWGSRRIGPDLHRVGNYRSTDWHENHMLDPKSVVPQSIMPAYPYMFTKTTDIDTAYAEALTVKKVFATPYDAPNGTKLGTLDEGRAAALEEAKAIAADMKNKDVKDAVARGEIPQIVALIAYLNRLK